MSACSGPYYCRINTLFANNATSQYTTNANSGPIGPDVHYGTANLLSCAPQSGVSVRNKLLYERTRVTHPNFVAPDFFITQPYDDKAPISGIGVNFLNNGMPTFSEPSGFHYLPWLNGFLGPQFTNPQVSIFNSGLTFVPGPLLFTGQSGSYCARRSFTYEYKVGDDEFVEIRDVSLYQSLRDLPLCRVKFNIDESIKVSGAIPSCSGSMFLTGPAPSGAPSQVWVTAFFSGVPYTAYWECGVLTSGERSFGGYMEEPFYPNSFTVNSQRLGSCVAWEDTPSHPGSAANFPTTRWTLRDAWQGTIDSPSGEHTYQLGDSNLNWRYVCPVLRPAENILNYRATAINPIGFTDGTIQAVRAVPERFYNGIDMYADGSTTIFTLNLEGMFRSTTWTLTPSTVRSRREVFYVAGSFVGAPDRLENYYDSTFRGTQVDTWAGSNTDGTATATISNVAPMPTWSSLPNDGALVIAYSIFPWIELWSTSFTGRETCLDCPDPISDVQASWGEHTPLSASPIGLCAGYLNYRFLTNNWCNFPAIDDKIYGYISTFGASHYTACGGGDPIGGTYHVIEYHNEGYCVGPPRITQTQFAGCQAHPGDYAGILFDTTDTDPLEEPIPPDADRRELWCKVKATFT